MGYNSLSELFKAIADAIRSKTGSTTPIVANDFPAAIAGISTEADHSMEDGLVSRTLTEYINDRVTSVGSRAFASYSSLISVTLPSVTQLDGYAFEGCSHLTSVTLPSVTKLANYVFNGCTNLTSVDFPSATETGLYTFQNCTNLTSVNFPLATSINHGAFYNCESLVKADFPHVTSIGNSAFQGASSLRALILRHQYMVQPPSSPTMLKNTPIADGTGYIYVPANLMNSYRGDPSWANHSNQFRALEDYTVDGTITGELDLTKMGL